MSVANPQLLERLNRGSVERSFTPQRDVDWANLTTEAEFAALYDAWSLFAGTGVDAALTGPQRVAFAKYQQMNLMLVTSLLELRGIATLSRLFDLDDAPAFQEYVGHFIKEEVYHHMLFSRAIAAIAATQRELPPLPSRAVDRWVRAMFWALGLIPWRALRVSASVGVFRFAELATMIANQVAHRAVARREGLVNRVWETHALDEARHIAFDELLLTQYGLQGRWRALAALVVAPAALMTSLLLHLNELWAARQLGLRVSVLRLPSLARQTSAVFKRRVFELMAHTWRGTSPPSPAPEG